MYKQVKKTLSAAIKDAKSKASPDALTYKQARAYIMYLIKDTKAETTPDNPILKKVTLKSNLGKFKTSPKLQAPSVPSSVFPGTSSRRIEGATKT